MGVDPKQAQVSPMPSEGGRNRADADAMISADDERNARCIHRPGHSVEKLAVNPLRGIEIPKSIPGAFWYRSQNVDIFEVLDFRRNRFAILLDRDPDRSRSQPRSQLPPAQIERNPDQLHLEILQGSFPALLPIDRAGWVTMTSMAFDPIETDEKLDVAVKRPDIDAHLIRGCMVFAVVALVAYAIALIPFFLVRDLSSWSGLMKACLYAGIPSVILGALASRFAGVPGGSAFVAGSLMGAVFLYLKLRQMPVLAKLGEVDPIEYGDQWSYLIPLIWVVLALVTAFAAMSKQDYSTSMTMRPESEDPQKKH